MESGRKRKEILFRIEMAKVWSHFFIMIWVLYIISSGIYLFSRGFLLSRQAHTEINSCKKLTQCNPNDSEVTEIECVIQMSEKHLPVDI